MMDSNLLSELSLWINAHQLGKLASNSIRDEAKSFELHYTSGELKARALVFNYFRATWASISYPDIKKYLIIAGQDFDRLEAKAEVILPRSLTSSSEVARYVAMD